MFGRPDEVWTPVPGSRPSKLPAPAGKRERRSARSRSARTPSKEEVRTEPSQWAELTGLKSPGGESVVALLFG